MMKQRLFIHSETQHKTQREKLTALCRAITGQVHIKRGVTRGYSLREKSDTSVSEIFHNTCVQLINSLMLYTVVHCRVIRRRRSAAPWLQLTVQ